MSVARGGVPVREHVNSRSVSCNAAILLEPCRLLG